MRGIRSVGDRKGEIVILSRGEEEDPIRSWGEEKEHKETECLQEQWSVFRMLMTSRKPL